MKLKAITPAFVEFVPKVLEPGVLYISERYKTASHLCACGCGDKVVTPLSPVEWQLRRDGQEVTLSPSVGNWKYQCQSHYCIRRNRIDWLPGMTQTQIRRVQARDHEDKMQYVALVNKAMEKTASVKNTGAASSATSLVAKIWTLLQHWFGL